MRVYVDGKLHSTAEDEGGSVIVLQVSSETAAQIGDLPEGSKFNLYAAAPAGLSPDVLRDAIDGFCRAYDGTVNRPVRDDIPTPASVSAESDTLESEAYLTEAGWKPADLQDFDEGHWVPPWNDEEDEYPTVWTTDEAMAIERHYWAHHHEPRVS